MRIAPQVNSDESEGIIPKTDYNEVEMPAYKPINF